MNDKEFYQQLGRRLNCEPAALKAVEYVESCGKGGFLPSGRPQILFEGHIFYRELKKNRGVAYADYIARKYPDICYPKWTKKFYKGGEAEWDRLQKACNLPNISSTYGYMSASYGATQIMGFNYKLCNCSSIDEFLNKMNESREGQMELWFNFLINSGCLSSLQKKQWAAFAKRYNGPGYAQNRYDQKMAAAYKKYVEQGYNG